MAFDTHPHPGGLDLTSHALSLSELEPNSRILDAGCGEGDTCDFLQSMGYKVHGIDLHIPEQQESDDQFTQGDILALPWPDNSYDAVICECVLSVCGDERKALAEFNRVLSPHGKLILSDVYQIIANDENETPPLACGKLFSENEVCQLLKKSGFKLIQWEERSDDLRTLVLQTLWDDGSLDSLGFTGGLKGTGRIGYYLIIAEAIK